MRYAKLSTKAYRDQVVPGRSLHDEFLIQTEEFGRVKNQPTLQANQPTNEILPYRTGFTQFFFLMYNPLRHVLSKSKQKKSYVYIVYILCILFRF